MDLYTKIQQVTTDIHLTPYDRERMLHTLVEYTRHVPLRTGVVATHSVISSPKIFFTFFKSPYIAGALAIALIVSTGTVGVSYAATDALPGDLLYPVKVRVNEEVKTAFLDTDEARIAWERERAELRLEEASRLAKEGRLSPELSSEVLQYFAEHAESVVAQARDVGVEDPFLAAEVTDEFEQALDAHEAVLARLTVDQEGAEDITRTLVTQVHTIAVETAKVRDAAEAQIDSEIAATGTTDVAAPMKPDAPQITREPAHMREQAVYRAEAKSYEHLLRVEALLREIDQNEPIVSEARTQVEDAIAQRVQGKRYEEEGDLRSAYRTYREVATSLQNIGQVLEMQRMFSVQIRPRATSEGDDHTLDTDIQKLFNDTSMAITEARTALLIAQGLDTEVYQDASARIKDASADLLRGNISRSLGEEVDARNLYKSAKESAEYAQRMLSSSDRVIQSSIKSVESHTTKPVVHLLTTHTDTTDILTGTITGLSCVQVSARVEVAAGTGESVLVLNSASTPSTHRHCTSDISKNVMFTLSSSTPFHSLRAVVLDGIERPFVVREDTHTYGTNTLQNTPESTDEVLNRVFDAAQDMF